MTILDVDLSTVLNAALSYVKLGFSVLPVDGKQPALSSWKTLQTRRATLSDVFNWSAQQYLYGVGIISGAISGGLVIMDLDGLTAVADYEASFPNLRNTYTVLSGSGKGKHFYYYVDVLPPTTRTTGYELRSNGLYVVAPPSRHTLGGLYTVCHAAPIMRLASLANVRHWINAKKPAFEAEPVGMFRDKPSSFSSVSTPREKYFAERYVREGLRRQLEMVARATLHNRNTQLYLSSVASGQLSATGIVTRADVESHLLNAALQCGLPENEARATIQSGLNTGEQHPRQIPPPPPERQ